MTWRYLPLGDSFVDFMASRDIDSSLIQREIDSVNVWLNSNTLFHVMRGNTIFLNLIKINSIYSFKTIKRSHWSQCANTRRSMGHGN